MADKVKRWKFARWRRRSRLARSENSQKANGSSDSCQRRGRDRVQIPGGPPHIWKRFAWGFQDAILNCRIDFRGRDSQLTAACWRQVWFPDSVHFVVDIPRHRPLKCDLQPFRACIACRTQRIRLLGAHLRFRSESQCGFESRLDGLPVLVRKVARDLMDRGARQCDDEGPK
jgi:hypothetical protein